MRFSPGCSCCVGCDECSAHGYPLCATISGGSGFCSTLDGAELTLRFQRCVTSLCWITEVIGYGVIQDAWWGYLTVAANCTIYIAVIDLGGCDYRIWCCISEDVPGACGCYVGSPSSHQFTAAAVNSCPFSLHFDLLHYASVGVFNTTDIDVDISICETAGDWWCLERVQCPSTSDCCGDFESPADPCPGGALDDIYCEQSENFFNIGDVAYCQLADGEAFTVTAIDGPFANEAACLASCP